MSFQSPNYTMAPNDLFDDLLKEINELSELKVTLAAVRHTFGHHRGEAEMSITWFEKVTGLARESVKRGIGLAIKRGTLRVVKEHTATTSTVYAVNVEDGVRGLAAGTGLAEGTGGQIAPLKKEELVSNNDTPVQKIESPSLQDQWHKELEKATNGYMGDGEMFRRLTEAWQQFPDPRRHAEGLRRLQNARSRTAKVYIEGFLTFNPDYVPPTPKPTYSQRPKPGIGRAGPPTGYTPPSAEERAAFHKQLAGAP
jgi:hypothetical protein